MLYIIACNCFWGKTCKYNFSKGNVSSKVDGEEEVENIMKMVVIGYCTYVAV